ncbi:MAG: efflux RND transporter permease subunit, partial [Luteitalea sp.]
LWSSGTGSELMRRIAVPMVGGMVSSTLLTLLVIPTLYDIMAGTRDWAGGLLRRGAALRHRAPSGEPVDLPTGEAVANRVHLQ